MIKTDNPKGQSWNNDGHHSPKDHKHEGDEKSGAHHMGSHGAGEGHSQAHMSHKMEHHSNVEKVYYPNHYTEHQTAKFDTGKGPASTKKEN